MTLVLRHNCLSEPVAPPIVLDRRRRRLSAVVKRHAPKDRPFIVSVHRKGETLRPQDHNVRLPVRHPDYHGPLWSEVLVGPKDIVLITEVPRGGGGGNAEAKQIGAALAMVALIAVTGFTALPATLANALVPFGTATASTVSAVKGILVVGGALAISAATQSAANTTERKNLYSVAGGTNVARPGARIPEVFGEYWVKPDLAQPDYSQYDGDDVVLRKRMTIGPGEYEVLEVQIGDVTMWTAAGGVQAPFAAPPGGGGPGQIGYVDSKARPGSGGGCEVEVIPPGGTSTLVPESVFSSSAVGGELPRPSDGIWQGPFPTCPPGKETDTLQIDFGLPEGCYHQAQTHAGEDATTYDGLWEIAPCDADNNATGAYVTLLHATETLKKTSAVRFTREIYLPDIDVAKGRHLVRAKNQKNDLEDESNHDAITWDGLRAHFGDTAPRQGVTDLALKIRSGKSLGVTTFGEVYVKVRRKLRQWDFDNNEWIVAPTRKAVWTYLYLLTSDNAGNLPDTEVDIERLKYYASTLTDYDTFDGIIQGPVSLYEACATVLNVMRAEPTRIGNVWSINRDEAKSVRKHKFTRRQIARGTSSGSIDTDRSKGDSDVVVEFNPGGDPRRHNQARATFGEETLTPRRLGGTGISSYAHAYQHATWYAVAAFYRRETHKFTSELQGRLVQRGDPASVDMWFISDGRAGGVLSRDGYNIGLDTDVVIAETGDTYASFRDRKGREWGPVKVTAGDKANRIVVDETDAAAAASDSGVAFADVFALDGEDMTSVVVGPLDTTRLLISKAVPQKRDRVAIEGLIDADEVYEALGEEPPAPPSLPSQGDIVEPDVSVLPWVRARCIQKGAGLAMEWAIGPARGAGSYRVELSYDSGDTWEPVSTDLTTSGTYPIRHEDAATLKIGALAISKKGNPGPAVYATFTTFKVDITGETAVVWSDALEDDIKKTLSQVEPNVAAVAVQTKAVIDKWVEAKKKADDLLGQVKRVQASSDAAHAAIVQNQTVQESQNEAFAALFTAMAAQVAANSAGIVSEASVRAERDGAITSLLTALTSVTNGNSAAIVSEASTRSSADSAMASDITGLTTTVGGHTASIGTLTSTVNGVKVQFGVTGTINGVTGGFVFTGIQKLDGTVSYAVEIDGDLVVDGTITGGKLAATDIITLSAQIQAAIIKTAHIDNLQVTRLKIGDDEVNIDKLEQGAAAATAYQDHTAIRTLASPWTSGLPGDFRDVVSLSITTIGDGVEMFYYVRYLAFYRNTGISSGSRAPVQFRFVVDGTPEDTFDFVATEKAGTVFYIDEPIVLASFKATLSSGAHTIKIQANRGAGNYTGGDTADNEIGPGRLKVIELRKAA